MNQTAVQLALLAAGIGGKRLGAAAWGGKGIGADIAGSVGAFALQYALGALLPGPKTKTQGSRLSDLQQTFSTYGVTIPIVFGDAVIGGNYIWTPKPALLEKSTTETTGSSKGLAGQNVLTTYQYYLSAAIGLCEGPIRGVRRIWCNDTLIFDEGKYTIDGSTTAYQLYDETPDDGVYIAPGIKLFFGTETQLPSAFIESFEGAGRVSAHRGIAYLLLEYFPMEKFGNGSSVLNFKVEVSRYVAVEQPITTTLDDDGEDLVDVYCDYDQETGTLVVRQTEKVLTENEDLVTVGGPLILQMPDGSGGYRRVEINTADIDAGVPLDTYARQPVLASNGFVFLSYADPAFYACYQIVDAGAELVSARLPNHDFGPQMGVGSGLPLNFGQAWALPQHTPLGTAPTAFASVRHNGGDITAPGLRTSVVDVRKGLEAGIVVPLLETTAQGPIVPASVAYQAGVGWVPSGNWYLYSESAVEVFDSTGHKLNTLPAAAPPLTGTQYQVRRAYPDNWLERVGSADINGLPVYVDPARAVITGPGWVTQLWDM